MEKKIVLIVLLLISANCAFGQVFTNREINPLELAENDSLIREDYPYMLPILGKKVTAAGYDLPYSGGLSINFFAQTSDIILEDLSVGFNGGEMYDLSGLVKFDVARSRASSLTFRPDVWLLPFLNVYGILGRAQASTEVKYNVCSGSY